MHRFLIGVAVVVVLLTVGAVVAVTLSRQGGQPAAEPEENAGPKIAKTTPVEADTPATSTRPRRTRTTTVTPADDTKPAETKAATQPAETAADSERAAEIREMVTNMSDDDRRILERELRRVQMGQMQDRRRYDMPSDRRLRRLERTRDDALRLNAAQQQQIETLREAYKPQLDSRLADIWQQQAALREQAADLMAEGNRDASRELFQQMGELNNQAEAIKTPLDEQYKASLATILTPEQMQALEQQSDEGGGRDGGRRPGGFRGFGGNPGGGNPGGAGG